MLAKIDRPNIRWADSIAMLEGKIDVLQHLLTICDNLEVKEIDLEDAKDMARRDIAWNVHVMISEGKSVAEIDHYVCSVCDF
jgi:hypothetical protein